MLGYDTIILKD